MLNKTFNLSSTPSDFILEVAFQLGDSSFSIPTPVQLDGYWGELVLTCKKQVLVNEKSSVITFTTLDDVGVIKKSGSHIYIHIPSDLLKESFYFGKLTLLNNNYRVPVYVFNLNLGYLTVYNPLFNKDIYTFDKPSLSLFDINR